MSDGDENSRVSQPVAMIRQRYGWPITVVTALILFVVTTIVYSPAFDYEFVNWDDERYVSSQPWVLKGLSWDGLRWAMTSQVVGNWHPLTMISLQCDAQFFGVSPRGFHRTAVLIHALNAVLAYLSIRTLTGSHWKSAIVAALFALHPLRIESVAWISERKDLLSGFFFFLIIGIYAGYAAKPSRGRYVLLAICLVMGLCAKSMLVTVPCVLLLLDYWPLNRLPHFSIAELVTRRNLIFEKLPLFGIVVVMCIITVLSQESGLQGLNSLPLGDRVKNATVSYFAYLAQTYWPTGLSPFYSIREIGFVPFAGAFLALLAITGLALWQRERRPYLLVGWFWFVGMLVPVIGIIQVGEQARADRYTYLPQIGIFLMIVWASAEVARRSRPLTIGFASLVVIFLAGCCITTGEQIPVWRNTVSLFRRMYQCNPDNDRALEFYLKAAVYAGEKEEALEQTKQSIRETDASNLDRMVMLAMLLAEQGDHEACAQTLSDAIKFHPDVPELYSNRGKAYAACGRWTDAVEDYRQAAQRAPRSISFQFYLAHALGKIGHLEESRQLFATAVRTSPNWPKKAASDSWRMSTSSDPRERVDFWPICLAEQAIAASGDIPPQLLDILAAAYAQSGRFDEAVTTAKLAIRNAEYAQQRSFANTVRERLALYEKREPYREPATIQTVGPSRKP